MGEAQWRGAEAFSSKSLGGLFVLVHPSASSGQSYRRLVFASIESGVLDVHELVRHCLAHQASQPRLGAALAAFTPELFAAGAVRLRAFGEVALRAGLSVELPTLQRALVWVDALVVLALARLQAAPRGGMPPSLSRREQAVWKAATRGDWPRIVIDEALRPSALHRAGVVDGARLAECIDVHGEAQLAGSGPLQVWMGSLLPARMLAPTLHHTGEALCAAGPKQLAQLRQKAPGGDGQSMGIHEQARFDTMEAADRAYALQHAIELVDPAVRHERREFERGCGFVRIDTANTEFELVSAQRVEPDFIDSRLADVGRRSLSPAGPALLVCAAPLGRSSPLAIGPSQYAVGLQAGLASAGRPPARTMVLCEGLQRGLAPFALPSASAGWEPDSQTRCHACQPCLLANGANGQDAAVPASSELTPASIFTVHAQPAGGGRPLWQAVDHWLDGAAGSSI